MKGLIKGCIAIGVIGGVSACSLTDGGMFLVASPKAINEYGRYQNGLVVTGKASPDIKDAYHITQEATDSSLNSLKAKLAEMSAGGAENGY